MSLDNLTTFAVWRLINILLNMTPCRESKHWTTLAESVINLQFQQSGNHATCYGELQSKWAQLRGGLKLQDQSLALPSVQRTSELRSVDFEDFYCQVITWQYHQFSSQHAWTPGRGWAMRSTSPCPCVGKSGGESVCTSAKADLGENAIFKGKTSNIS